MTALLRYQAALLLVTLISDPASADHRTRVPLPAAAALARPGGARDAAGGTAVRGGDRLPGTGGGQRPGHRLAVRHGPGPLLPLAGAAVTCALTSRRSA
jgi:hypothetical protein